jgi:hypothetical protein
MAAVNGIVLKHQVSEGNKRHQASRGDARENTEVLVFVISPAVAMQGIFCWQPDPEIGGVFNLLAVQILLYFCPVSVVQSNDHQPLQVSLPEKSPSQFFGDVLA